LPALVAECGMKASWSIKLEIYASYLNQFYVLWKLRYM